MIRLRNVLAMAMAGASVVSASADTSSDLAAIFADKACTQLAPAYQAMSLSDLQADEHVKALPQSLKNLVVKVKTGDWSEGEGSLAWDSNHALKYRVQLVEPISEGYAASQMIYMKPHTNIGNLSGLVADKGSTLYVMVEGEVKDGAELWLGELAGAMTVENMASRNDMNVVRTTAHQLHEGLNTITINNDMVAPVFYYSVTTYDVASGSTTHALDEFPDLKIHIEGGDINGFFNPIGDELYTPDTNADFQYTLARAKHPDFGFVGRYTLNLWPTDPRWDDTRNADNAGGKYPALRQLAEIEDYDPTAVVKRWDDMASIVRTTAGMIPPAEIQSTEWGKYYEPSSSDNITDYFNNPLLNIMMPDVTGVAMWSSTWYNGCCAYTSSSAMNTIAASVNPDDLWGPTHEYGHSVQYPIMIPGSTEISNNIHSNVALYFLTNTASRAEFISHQRALFNEGQPWEKGKYWTATRMYFQLWLYYHLLGHNKSFYPRLHEILRAERISGSKAEDYLTFMRACCEAAGEDLTEYFDAWGLLRPLNKYQFDDYGVKTLNLSQAQINELKAEIKAMNLPANHQILFIDDRVNTSRDLFPNDPRLDPNDVGEYGSIADFSAGSKSNGKYSFAINGTDITIADGEGGVGFLILNEDGSVGGFSNQLAFDVNLATSGALVAGSATLYSVDADGKLTAIPLQTEGIATSLQTILDEITSIESLAEQGLIGSYYPDMLTEISPKAAEARSALASGADTATLSALYGDLSSLLTDLKANPYARRSISNGGTYTLVSNGFPTFSMTHTDGALLVAENVEAPANQWILEAAPAENNFYFNAAGTDLYIGHAAALSSQYQLVEAAAREPFVVEIQENGTLVFTEASSQYQSLHVAHSKDVVAWFEHDLDRTQWLVSEIETTPAGNLRNELDRHIYAAEALIAQAGTVAHATTPLPFSLETNAKCEMPGDAFTSWDVLTDGDVSTYFHSNWGGQDSDDGLDHYLMADLGETLEPGDIIIDWTTRGVGKTCAPIAVRIQASADGKEWTDYAILNKDMPVANGIAFTSNPVAINDPFRYLRYMVLATSAGEIAEGHQFFALSEFGLSKSQSTASPAAPYAGIEAQLLDAFRAVNDARNIYALDDTDRLASADTAVVAATEALRAAMASGSGISLPELDNAADNAPKGIYDLQGRRLRDASAPGIYIIDGRKTIVR